MAKNDFTSLWLEEPKRAYDPIIGTTSFTWDMLPSIGIKRRKRMKVIFNDPATILFVDGEKFVVKCHEEKFDEEKAVAIALLKSFGISYPDLKRIIKNAKRPESKKENK